MSGAGDNTILSWAADLGELEDQIATLQDAKRDLYATVREDHGKATAAALKTAVKLSRMDGDKRAERDEIDAEAGRILSLIESRAPRATRARVETIEEIPPETAVQAPSIGGVSPGSQSPDEADADASTGGEHESSVSDSPIIGKVAAPSAEAEDAPHRKIDETVERSDVPLTALGSDVEVVARKLNPATHFRNSKGMARLHGCQDPDTCAGSHRELCAGCKRVVEAA